MPHDTAHGIANPGVGVPEDELILGEAHGLPLRYNKANSLITIGGSGSGKFASMIAPNLLHYTGGSVIVNDPKGESAAVTQRFRRSLGKAFIINPFNVLLRELGLSACFNPMADLDPLSDTFTSDVGALAAAIVLDGPAGHDGFFTKSARNLVGGLIAHLRMQDSTLVDVSDVLHMRKDEFNLVLEHMMESPYAVVHDAAVDMLDTGKGGQDSVRDTLRTARNEFKAFMSADGIRRCLSRSDFKWSDLKREKTTVYIVLPEAESKTFSRFTRLLYASSLKALLRDYDNPLPVYYLMDEIATSIGESELDLVETAVSLGRGYGVRAHLVFQNYGQLKDIFKGRAASVESGAGVMQFFEASDETTFEKMRSRGGKTTLWIETENRQENWGQSGGTSSGGGTNGHSSTNIGWNRGASKGQSEQPIPVDLIDANVAYQLGSMDRGKTEARQILIFRGLTPPVMASRTAYYVQPHFAARADPNPYIKK